MIILGTVLAYVIIGIVFMRLDHIYEVNRGNEGYESGGEITLIILLWPFVLLWLVCIGIKMFITMPTRKQRKQRSMRKMKERREAEHDRARERSAYIQELEAELGISDE